MLILYFNLSDYVFLFGLSYSMHMKMGTAKRIADAIRFVDDYASNVEAFNKRKAFAKELT